MKSRYSRTELEVDTFLTSWKTSTDEKSNDGDSSLLLYVMIFACCGEIGIYQRTFKTLNCSMISVRH